MISFDWLNIEQRELSSAHMWTELNILCFMKFDQSNTAIN